LRIPGTSQGSLLDDRKCLLDAPDWFLACLDPGRFCPTSLGFGTFSETGGERPLHARTFFQADGPRQPCRTTDLSLSARGELEKTSYAITSAPPRVFSRVMASSSALMAHST